MIAFAGALGTLPGATVAPVVNYWTNERQMDVKMVEIGIGILRSSAPASDASASPAVALRVTRHGRGVATDRSVTLGF
jgi:hypothetical protein